MIFSVSGGVHFPGPQFYRAASFQYRLFAGGVLDAQSCFLYNPQNPDRAAKLYKYRAAKLYKYLKSNKLRNIRIYWRQPV